MLSLQEISDRLEIQQLPVTYASSIDQHNFDGLDQVFTPTAYIDYRALGGIDGKFPEVKAWLKQVLPGFGRYYHMVGNMDLKLSGDTAAARTICFNPMEVKMPDGKTQVMFIGLWYVDKFVRTPQGWRMSERIEEACYSYNVPSHIDTSKKA